MTGSYWGGAAMWSIIRGFAGAAALGLGVVMAVPGSPPIVVTEFDATAALTGEGWAQHPDATAGSTQVFVEGPATPPAGRGSLELGVDSTSDRALVFTAPGFGDDPVQRLMPWEDVSGSYSAFTFIETNTASVLPALKLVGYQLIDPDAPLPADRLMGFTTLNFEPAANQDSPAVAGEWQEWVLDGESIVWQSNAGDAFCVQADRCTLAEFAAHYPDGGWGIVQLGLGSGVVADGRSFVDDVMVRNGTTDEFAFDFEVAAELNSTAAVAPGAATETGGTAVVTLDASTVAADSVVFTITTTAPDGSVESIEVELPAGASDEVEVAVPHGTSRVAVSAQGVELAAADVTFAAATPTPPPSPSEPPAPAGSGSGSGDELAESGFDGSPLMAGLALLMGGAAALAASAAARRRRATANVD